MIDKCYFKDNKPRQFIPYKSYITDSGEVLESGIEREERDISIESIFPTPHEHWKYNLKNKEGELLLPKNVRKIEWNEAGYYIVYDDNEDELHARYRGPLPLSEFHYEYWIVDKEGKFLSELSFQDAKPYPNSTIRVEYSYKYNILNLNGDFLFFQPVDCIFGFYGGLIFFVNEGVLYRSTINGKIEMCRELRVFNKTGKFYCGYGNFIVNGVTSGGVPMDSCKYFSHGYHGIFKGYDDDIPLNKLQSNILIKGRYLLFDNWYYYLKNSGFGIFEINNGDDESLINANENLIVNHAVLVISDESFIVYKKDGKFFVSDYDGNQINQEFTSCIWAVRDGTWNIFVADEINHKCYYSGESPELLNHAQCFIVSNNVLALLERDSIWYWIDKTGKLWECFRNYKHIF